MKQQKRKKVNNKNKEKKIGSNYRCWRRNIFLWRCQYYPYLLHFKTFNSNWSYSANYQIKIKMFLIKVFKSFKMIIQEGNFVYLFYEQVNYDTYKATFKFWSGFLKSIFGIYLAHIFTNNFTWHFGISLYLFL